MRAEHGCRVLMADFPIEWTDPDQLFSVVFNLTWQLHYDAAELGLALVALDLVIGAGELEQGLWRNLGRLPEMSGMPFTILCSLLEGLLVELARVTPAFAARVAVARATQLSIRRTSRWHLESADSAARPGERRGEHAGERRLPSHGSILLAGTGHL